MSTSVDREFARRLVEATFLERHHIDVYGVDDAMLDSLIEKATSSAQPPLEDAIEQIDEVTATLNRAWSTYWQPGEIVEWQASVEVSGPRSYTWVATNPALGRSERAESPDELVELVRQHIS